MAKHDEVNRKTVIGRIVHFAAELGHCCPAMIIGTYNSTEGTEVEVPEKDTVHLMVFDPDGDDEDGAYRAWNVPHNVSGEPDTYHWQDACAGG